MISFMLFQLNLGPKNVITRVEVSFGGSNADQLKQRVGCTMYDEVMYGNFFTFSVTYLLFS